MRIIVCIVILASATAQTAEPRFEVASIKPSPPDSLNGRMSGGPGTKDPGIFICEGVDLASIVMSGFGIRWVQFSGPAWMRSTKFDISAKIPEGITKEKFRLMQQNLLVERFKMTFHHERHEMQIYGLVVAKNGPKLKESPDTPPPGDPNEYKPPPGPVRKDKDGFPAIPDDDPREMMSAIDGARWVQRFGRRSMEQLAGYVETLVDRPVEDETGLKGKFDFTLKWINNRGRRPDDDYGPTIFEALQQQLGLKLEQHKAIVDVFVVDHIEKTPTEN
jgi:uncharacterized protein (TIGR03435 family)